MCGPMRPQVRRKLVDRHAVEARTPLVRLDPAKRFLQVFSLTHYLHQRVRNRRAFGLALRHIRFGTLTADGHGQVCVRRGEGQLKLFGQPLSVHESYVLVAALFIPLSGTVRAFSAVSLPVTRLVSVAYYAVC